MEKDKMNNKGTVQFILVKLKEMDRSIETWIQNMIEEIEDHQTRNLKQKG